MHEMSLMEGVLSIVLDAQREHGFSRVITLTLEVGAVSGVEPEALEFCFEAVMAGSPAAGAKLDLLLVPAKGWCASCEEEVQVESRADLCPKCSGIVGALSQGSDLKIKDLEVE